MHAPSVRCKILCHCWCPPPINTHVRMCRCMHQISALILSSCSVCVCQRPFMLVCLCDLAFCLSAALQSTSCILTQSLRHKWEHQNLSAVLHTAVPRGRQREGGREVGGGLTNLASVSPSSSSNVCISPFLSRSLPLPFFLWQIEAQGRNVAWLNTSDFLPVVF